MKAEATCPVAIAGCCQISRDPASSFRMTRVLGKVLLVFILALAQACAPLGAQQQPAVKVNVLNVCAPSAEEQKEISSALSHVPRPPTFSEDFEVARGRSSLSGGGELLQAGPSAQLSEQPSVASWVRLRRELAAQATFSTVQYSFSDDGKNMVETLVLHVRDPKDLVQLSIEDSASAVTSPATMLAAATPASRIKLERFGKSSVVLARCTGSAGSPLPDQSVYEPLFAGASLIMSDYRTLLNARRTVPAELARVATAAKAANQPAAAKSQTSAPKTSASQRK